MANMGDGPPVKCRVLGHRWFYMRDKGVKTCTRCDESEEYRMEEDHSDRSAEKGESRYRLSDDGLYIESYTTTAISDEKEWWRWFPYTSGPDDDESLRDLRDQINERLGEES